MAGSNWTGKHALRAWLLGTTALLPAIGAAQAQAPAPNARPTGGQVVAGSASINQGSASTTTITQTTDRAAINWQSFNVGGQQTVQFQQPSATSWTLNRVTAPDPSVIAGRITANGGVAIVNQSGVVFAQGAQVNVGSLIASAANITNQNFMAGRMVFDGAPNPGAKVENHGDVTIADRGLAALVGPRVTNSGTIRARLGRVALAGAETYSLDLAGDGLLSIDVTQAVRATPAGTAALVTNSGVIEAAGGSVLISAHAASGLVEDLVRNTGRISAPTEAGRTGTIALRAEGGSVRVEGTLAATGGTGQRGGTVAVQATEGVTIAAGARVDASGGAGGGTALIGTTGPGRNQRMARRTSVQRGATVAADATASGNGGTVVVNSTEQTTLLGTLSARGGPKGGNGGRVEVSGQGEMALDGTVDVAAPAGSAGELVLDPVNITVQAGGTSSLSGDTLTASSGGGTLTILASTIENFVGRVTLDASNTVTFSQNVSKANGDLFVRADTISIANNITVAVTGIGNTLSLRADTISFGNAGSTVSAPSGTLEFGVLTASRTITIGPGGGGGTLRLDPGDLAATVAGTIRIGSTTQSDATAQTVTTAGIAVNDAVTFTSAATQVELVAAGNITSSNNSTVTGPSLRLTAGGNVTLGNTAGLTASGTGGTIEISAGTLTLGTGTSLAGRVGGRVALRADTLDLSTVTVQSDGGNLAAFEIGPRTSGRGVLVGGTSGSTLNLVDTTRLTGAPADTVIIGQTTINGAAVQGGNLTIGSDLDFATRALTLRSADAIAVNGTLASATLDVQAVGNITTAAAGAGAITSSGAVTISGAAVTLGSSVTANGGALSVTATGALQTASAAALTASGRLSLQGAGGITLGGNLTATGNQVVLRTGDSFDTPTGTAAITQQATSIIAADSLSASAGGGITLGTAANAIASLAAGRDANGTLATRSVASASGSATIVTGASLNVAAPVVLPGTGTASLTASAITTAAAITAGNVSLFADAISLGAAITASAGAGVVTLAPLTNADIFVGAADPADGRLFLATANLAQVSAPVLRLGTAASGAITLDGAIDLTGKAATLDLRGLSATQGGAGALTVNTVSAVLSDAAGLVLDHATNEIAAVGTISASAGPVTVVSSSGLAVGSGGIVAGGDVNLTGAALALAGAVNAGANTVTLRTSAGGISQGAAGVITAGLVDAVTVGGAVALATATGGNLVGSVQGASGTGGFSFSASGALAVSGTGITAGSGLGNVSLTSVAGNVTQGAGSAVNGATLTVTADSGVLLTDANNQIGKLQAGTSTGGVSVRSSTGLELTGTGVSVTTSGGVTLRADSLTLTAGVGAAGQTVSLTADGGGITQGSAGAIVADALRMVAAGAIDVGAASGNAFSFLGATTTLGGVAAASSTGFTVDAVITAQAGNSIALTAPGLAISQALSFSAADPGNRIILTTDALSATAAIDAGATGTVKIATRGGSAGIDVGGSSATLNLATTVLDQVAAARLVLQSNAGITFSSSYAFTTSAAELIAAGGGISQAGGTALTVASLSAAAGAGSVNLTGQNLVDSIDPSTEVAGFGLRATGNIAFTSAKPLLTIATGATIQAGSNANVTLRADDLALNAAIQAPGGGNLGRVSLLPNTAGTAVTLGGTAAGTLSLAQAELNLIAAHAGTLGIGADGTATTAGLVTIAGNTSVTTQAATLDLRGQQVVQTGGVLEVALLTGGVATVNGVAAAGFAADRLSGGVAVNSIQSVGPITADGGAISIASATDLAVLGDVTATATSGSGVALRSEGALQIGANRLVRAAGGDVILSAGGAFTLGADATVRAQDPALANGNISIIGGTLALNGTLDAGAASNGGSISLTATNGTIAVSQNLDARLDVTLNASGTVDARTSGTGAAIVIGGGVGVTGGGIVQLSDSTAAGLGVVRDIDIRGTLSGTGGVSVGTLSGAIGVTGTGTVTTSGAATLTAGLGITQAGSIGAGSLVRLDAGTAGTSGGIALSGNVTASTGDVVVRTRRGDITQTAGTLSATSAAPRGTVALVAEAGSITQSGTGRINATQLIARAAGSVSLGVFTGGLGNAVGTLLGTGATGGLDATAFEAGDPARLGSMAGTDFALRSTVPMLTVRGLVRAGTQVDGTGTPVAEAAGKLLRLLADDIALDATLSPSGMVLSAPLGQIELAPHTTANGMVLGGAAASSTGGALTLDSIEIGLIDTRPASGIGAGTVVFGRADGGAITLAGAVDLRDAPGSPTEYQNVRARNLALASGGAVTQTAGRVNVENLAVRSGGAVSLDQVNVVNAVTGGVASVAAVGGSAGFTVSGIAANGDVTLRVGGRAGVADGTLAASGTVPVLPPSLDADGAPTAGVAALRIAGNITAGGAGDLTIRADDLAVTAELNAGSSRRVVLQPVTSGQAVLLGGAVTGPVGSEPAAGSTLSLTAAELGFVTSGLLRIGGLTSLDPAAASAGRAVQGQQAIDLTGHATTLEVLSAYGFEQRGALLGNTPGANLTVANLAATIRTADRASGADLDAASVWLGADNRIGRIGDTTGLAVSGGAGIRLTIDRAATDSMLPGNAVTLREAAGQAVRVTDDGIALNRAGGRVTLVADRLSTTAPVTVNAGAIELLPRTAGLGLRLGTASTLADGDISAGTIAQLATNGGVLRIGRSVDAAVAGGAFYAPIGGGDGVVAGVLGPDNSRLAGSIAVAGNLNLRPVADTLELYAGVGGEATPGTITQASGTAIDAANLAGGSRGFTALLNSGNSIDALAQRSLLGAADTGVSFRAGTAAATSSDAVFALRTGSNLLTVNGQVSVGVGAGAAGSGTTVATGGAITLIADDLALNAALVAPGGTVALAPHTTGRHIALGRTTAAAGSNELALGAAELATHIRAQQLIIGRAPDTGSVALLGRLSDGGAISGAAQPVAGTIRQYGANIDLIAPGDAPGVVGFGESAQGAAGTLTLVAQTSIQQRGRNGGTAAETEGNGPDTGDARGWLRVDNLTGSAGSFIWLGAENRIANLAGAVPTGGIDGIAVGGVGTPGVLVLRQASAATALADGLGSGVLDNGVNSNGTLLALGGTGSRITLAADALNIPGGTISAPGGTVEILPVTPGRGIVLGGATPGTLSLLSSELVRIGDTAGATSFLRFGRSTDPAVAGNAAWPASFAIGVSEPGAAVANARTAGDITLAGDVVLRDGTDANRVRRLELFAGVAGGGTGSIDQTGGRLNVADLAGDSRFATTLTSATNRVDRLAARTAILTGETAIAFTSGTGTASGDAATSGSFSLVTTQALTVAAPVIASHAAAAGTANLALTSGGDLAVNAAVTAKGALALTATGSITVAAGIAASGGSAAFQAGTGITNLGSIGATATDLSLVTTAGDIVTDAGPIVAGRDTTLLAAGDITYASITGGRDVSLTSTGGKVTGIAGSGITATTGTATLSATAGSFHLNGNATVTGAGVSLVGRDDSAIGAGASVTATAGNAAASVGTGTLTLGTGVAFSATGGSVSLAGNGGLGIGTGFVSAATGSGSFASANGATSFGAGASVLVDGALTVGGRTGITIAGGTLRGGTGLDISVTSPAAGDIEIAAGSVLRATAGALTLNSTGGGVLLRAGADVRALNGSVAISGATGITGEANLVVSGTAGVSLASGGGAISLGNGTAITSSNGGVSILATASSITLDNTVTLTAGGGDLSVVAGTDIDTNLVGSFSATGGSVILTAGTGALDLGATTITASNQGAFTAADVILTAGTSISLGTVIAGRDATITAGTDLSYGSITATRNAMLTSTAGAVTGAASSSVIATSGSATVQALGGNVSLGSDSRVSGGTAATVGAIAGGGGAGTVNLATLTQILAGSGDATVSAAGALTLGTGVQLRSTGAQVVLGGSGIGAGDTITVAAATGFGITANSGSVAFGSNASLVTTSGTGSVSAGLGSIGFGAAPVLTGTNGALSLAARDGITTGGGARLTGRTGIAATTTTGNIDFTTNVIADAASGPVTLTASTGSILFGGGSSVAAGLGALNISGAGGVTGGGGFAATATAGNASLTASAGTVALASGSSVVADAGTVTINGAAIDIQNAVTLRSRDGTSLIGGSGGISLLVGNQVRATNGAVSLGATGLLSLGNDNVLAAGNGPLSLTGAGIVIGTGLTATAAGALAVDAGGGSLTLGSGGALASGAGGTISGASIAIGSNESITAATGLSVIANTGSLLAGDSVTFRTTGGALLLQATASGINLGHTVTADGGSVTLTRATGLAIGTGFSSTAGAGSFATAGAGAVSIDADATVAANSGSIGIAGTSVGIGARGSMVARDLATLTATAGNVTLADSATLRATAGAATLGATAGSISIGNAVTVAGTGIGLASASGIGIGSGFIGTASAGAASFAGGAGATGFGTGSAVQAAGGLAVTSAAIAAGSGSTLQSGTGTTLTATSGTLRLDDSVAVRATAGATTLQASAADISLGNGVAATGSAGLTLQAATGIAIGTGFTGTATAGAVSFTGGGPATIGDGATLQAGAGSLGVAASSIGLGAGSLYQATAGVTAAGSAGGISVGDGTGLVASAGPVSLIAASTIGLGSGVTLGGTGVLVQANGDVTAGTGLSASATQTGGSLSIVSTGGVLAIGNAANLQAANGSVGLSGAAGLGIGSGGAVRALSTLSLTAGTGLLSLGAGTTAQATGGTASLLAGTGDITLGDGSVVRSSTGTLGVQAGRSIASSGLVEALGGSAVLTAATGSLTLQGTATANSGSVKAAAGVALSGQAGIGITGQAPATGSAFTSGIVQAGTGDLSLTSAAGNIAQSGGLLSVRGSGALVFSAAAGSFTQAPASGASIDAARLTGSARDGIELLAFAAGRSGAARGNRVENVGPLASSAGAIRLQTVEAETRIGAVTLSAPGAIQIWSERGLTLAGATLASSGTAVGSRIGTGAASDLTGTRTAAQAVSEWGGLVSLYSGGAVTVNNLVLNAEAASIRAGVPALGAGSGTLMLNGVNARIGSAVLFGSGAGILAGDAVVVSARGTSLPAALYDSRVPAGGEPRLSLVDTALGQVRPDLPGLPPKQQDTKVRKNFLAGDFGPGTAAPGGDIAVNLQMAALPGAPLQNQGAVFLLAGTGNITGSVDAGRLGVVGNGGSMTITGTLNGQVGANAAQFADLSQIAPATILQRYRINGCVVTSINCIVTPQFQVLPLRPVDRTSLTIEAGRLNTSEVIIPNVMDEDDE